MFACPFTFLFARYARSRAAEIAGLMRAGLPARGIATPRTLVIRCAEVRASMTAEQVAIAAVSFMAVDNATDILGPFAERLTFMASCFAAVFATVRRRVAGMPTENRRRILGARHLSFMIARRKLPFDDSLADNLLGMASEMAGKIAETYQHRICDLSRY